MLRSMKVGLSTTKERGTWEKNGTRSWSRRDFLKGAAAGTVSVAALGAMAGCSPQQTSSGASEPTASTEAGSYDVMKELSTFNRGEKPDAKAPATPEEYITHERRWRAVGRRRL